jgi:hypothetical protein
VIEADFARRHRERDLSVRPRSRAHERSHVEREHATAHPTAVVQRRERPLSKTKTTLSSRLISSQGSRKKKPARFERGTGCAVADQLHRVKSESCGDPCIFSYVGRRRFHRSVQSVQDCPRMPPGERQANSRFWARSSQVIVARGVSKADRHLRAPTRWSDDVSH